MYAGGVVAEWSKALLVREKINETQNMPSLSPAKARKSLIKFPFWKSGPSINEFLETRQLSSYIIKTGLLSVG